MRIESKFPIVQSSEIFSVYRISHDIFVRVTTEHKQ